MAFNGSGVFVRLYSWVQDAASNINIIASRMDNETSGIAAGLSNCVTRDGQSPPTANIPMGGFKLTNLAPGSATTDSANYGQINTLVVAATAAASSANAVAGIAATFQTNAAAVAGLGGVAANAYVQVLVDETRLSHRIMYQKLAGVLTFVLDFDIGNDVYLETWGAAGDGNPTTGAGTNDTAALNSALAALQAAGGGTLRLRRKCYKIVGDITMPTDGAPNSNGVPAMAPIRISGVGAHSAGQGAAPVGGSILMWTGANTANPRLQMHGQGQFSIDNVSLISRETGTGRPFIFTSNTTLKAFDFTIWTPKAPSAADDDIIILGGNTITFGQLVTSPFQGYGTVIERGYFNGVRSIKVNTFANAVRIAHNNWWNRCGSTTTGTGAIEIYGDTLPVGSSQSAVGALILGNLIEIGSNYYYGVKGHYSSGATIIGNDCYDATAQSPCAVYLDSTCQSNIVHESVGPAGKPYFIEQTVGNNTFIGTNASSFSTGIRSGNGGVPNAFGPTTFNGGNGVTIIQSTVSGDVGKLLTVKASAARGTDPGVDIFGFLGDGSIQINASGVTSLSGSGNITNSHPTGAGWSANGKSWIANGTGGAMVQDSGSGGSTYTAQNNQFIWKLQNGTIQGRFTSTAGSGGGEGLDLGAAYDVAIYRRSATCLETNVTFRVGAYTVATLPAPSATTKRCRAWVTDASIALSNAAYGTVVAGGGANEVPVVCNGTSWFIG